MLWGFWWPSLTLCGFWSIELLYLCVMCWGEVSVPPRVKTCKTCHRRPSATVPTCPVCWSMHWMSLCHPDAPEWRDAVTTEERNTTCIVCCAQAARWNVSAAKTDTFNHKYKVSGFEGSHASPCTCLILAPWCGVHAKASVSQSLHYTPTTHT